MKRKWQIYGLLGFQIEVFIPRDPKIMIFYKKSRKKNFSEKKIFLNPKIFRKFSNFLFFFFDFWIAFENSFRMIPNLNDFGFIPAKYEMMNFSKFQAPENFRNFQNFWKIFSFLESVRQGLLENI